MINNFIFDPVKCAGKVGKGRVDGNYWKFQTDAQMHDLPQMIVTAHVSDLIMDTCSNLADGMNICDKKVSCSLLRSLVLDDHFLTLVFMFALLPGRSAMGVWNDAHDDRCEGSAGDDG